MLRNLKRLADEISDLLVIGGGITGAAIARDASLRGLSVALIERNDFAHATSAHNSKLIHGGLRYLRTFELGLVRESLKERRVWQYIAPHLVQPLPFLLPVRDADLGGRLQLAAGLSLYDLLSYDRGRLADPGQRLPGHAWLGADALQELEPALGNLRLSGAFRYFDAQMYSPERLALECVLDAAENGAAIANHLDADTLLMRDGRAEGARVRDQESGAEFDVRARLTIIAAGPWADLFLARALGRPMHTLRRSKGIHIIVRALTRDHALTMTTKDGHFFALPWRGGSLLGTTDTQFDGDPDTVQAGSEEIEAFLGLVNAHLPFAELKTSDVRYAYAGLRPLVDDGSASTYTASRRAELIDHARKDGIGAVLSVIGGKWTTSRDLARKTVDAALGKLDHHPRACTTAVRRLPGGEIPRVAAFMTEYRANNEPSMDHLARLYGSRLPRLLALRDENPGLSATLSPRGDIGAQIVLAMREEMAVTLEDVVMRRTCIGQEGDPGMEPLARAATIMAGESGWSQARRRAEIDSVAAIFRGTGSNA